MAQCERCGAELKPGAKFCIKCGQPVGAPQMNKATGNTCSKCGAELKPGAKFCIKCGQPVSAAPQGETKGFIQNVGAGIQSAVTGGSFREGYQQQDQRTEEYWRLRRRATAQIAKAQADLKDLERKYDISAEASLEVDDLIKSIQDAIKDPKAEYGNNNSKISNGLKKLEEKIYDIRVSVDPKVRNNSSSSSYGANSDDARANGRTAPVVQLHTVNPDECVVVRNRVTWGVQPGQIARRITERELDTITGIKGFIISEGTSAMIFVNGELVDIFKSGAYTIPQKNDQFLKNEFNRLYEDMDKQDKEKRAKAKQEEKPKNFTEQGGLLGSIGRGISRIGEFFFGATPVKKEKEKNQELDRIKRLKADVEKALQKKNPDPVLSVILVSNRFIRLTFGGTPSETGISFNPIPIGIHDVEVGVSLTVKVTDIRPFVAHYLTDKNSFSTCDMFHKLCQPIENQLRMVLRNEIYEMTGLTSSQIDIVQRRLLDFLNEKVLKDTGIECVRIEQITDHNEAFERFRAVERELYYSEKEIDYLQRTGEIRNKLEQENNRQKINSCHNEEDLARAMQEIDKERILREDEMAEFILKLDFQRKVREAKNDEELYEALSDIKAKRLLKDEEMAVLEDELLKHKIERDSITEIMRIHTEENISRERMQSEWALTDARQDHEWEREDLARRRGYGIEDEDRKHRYEQEEEELRHQGITTAASLDIKRQLDAYADERDETLWDRDWVRNERSWNRNFEREQMQRKAEFEQRVQEENLKQDIEDKIAARKSKMAEESFARMERLKEQQRKAEQQRFEHEERIIAKKAETEQIKISTQAGMTPEQIVAASITGMSGGAQVAFAEGLGSKKEVEYLERQRREDEQRRKEEQEREDRRRREEQEREERRRREESEERIRLLQIQQGTVIGVNQTLYDAAIQQKNEYHDDLRHQQSRVDQTTDTALTSMAGINTAAASNLSTSSVTVNANVPSGAPSQGLHCPHCGKPIGPENDWCEECGAKLKD